MTFFISSLDPYQLSTASRADMGVSGWYPGWYGKGHVLISIYHMSLIFSAVRVYQQLLGLLVVDFDINSLE